MAGVIFLMGVMGYDWPENECGVSISGSARYPVAVGTV